MATVPDESDGVVTGGEGLLGQRSVFVTNFNRKTEGHLRLFSRVAHVDFKGVGDCFALKQSHHLATQ
jgi:hypothetical protein